MVSKIKGHKRYFRGFLFILGLFCLQACDNGVTPPAPPAEIPSALVFPSSIGIDVSTLQLDPSTPSALSILSLVESGGEFSNEISNGANVTDAEIQVIDNILAELDALSIPIGTTVTTYETTESRLDSNDAVEIVSYFRFDFADFDYDGDGQNEGCSGHTGSAPICFRLWNTNQPSTDPSPFSSDFVRLMAGVFTTYPSKDNPGAGRFKFAIRDNSQGGAIGGEDLLVGVIYDHIDPENKSSEIFGSGDVSVLDESGSQGTEEEGGGQSDDLGGSVILDGHLLITQVGPNATGIKTIKEATHYPDGESSQYFGQFKEGDDFWIGSGTFETASELFLSDFNDICARISTGEEVDTTYCTEAGLVTPETNFLPAATEADYDLPEDFPLTPTFQ